MEKASAFYDKLQTEMDDKEQDFYEYEEKLDDLITQFGKELLQDGLGSVPDDIRKKKSPNPIWENRDSGEARL